MIIVCFCCGRFAREVGQLRNVFIDGNVRRVCKYCIRKRNLTKGI